MIITTTILLISIVVCLLLLTVSYYVGKYFGKLKYSKYIKDYISSGKGKFGIIIYKSYNSHIDHVIEVEELESAGDYIKVRVVKVCTSYDNPTNSNKVLSNRSFNEWVHKSFITWYDDNSQRAREEKLEKILNENKD